MKNNLEICKIAVASDGKSIYYMSNEIKNNYEICKIAANNNPNSIKYMSDKMREILLNSSKE